MATVIIKDQSRIGRDVVEVGLLKRTFDEYHVRFIAANDNLDTANGFDIMSIFRDVINEWYVADTSRKIKAVFKSRMEKGLRCSGSVCYGYRASKEEKGEWIIDEEAAAVVRRIFQSVLDGETVASIAKAPRAEKIPIPSEHWNLTTPMLNEFIEKVVVHEGEGRRNDCRQREEQAAKEARSKELAKARCEKRKAEKREFTARKVS